ncbi:MAG: NADH-quinone oxidoreductase subunit A [Propionibacteriaceae bacterium]|jgi:NADH-quinone oxidoreductase subunit A|nr:NADH-quinone oxidoreductase subunit A [Propionibacteriaceae bacterium]
MNPYVPFLGLLALAAVAMAALILLSAFVGPRRKNRQKYDSYECGIDPTPTPDGFGRFPVKYYLIAMLYIVFDVEIVFLYPWAVAFDSLGLFALIEMLIFTVAIGISYVYIWRRGGLEWD